MQAKLETEILNLAKAQVAKYFEPIKTKLLENGWVERGSSIKKSVYEIYILGPAFHRDCLQEAHIGIASTDGVDSQITIPILSAKYDRVHLSSNILTFDDTSGYLAIDIGKTHIIDMFKAKPWR